MGDLGAGTVLRLAVLAGLAGFLVFCASYSLAVWRKRNQRRTHRMRWAGIVTIAGGIACLGTWIVQESTDRLGVVSGNDLFVVHARRDAQITFLSAPGVVEAGQLLTEFTPPAIEGQLAIIDSHIDEARARLAALEMRPLSLDALLLQRQGQLRTQLDQARTFRFDLRKSQRELEKDRLSLLTNWTREQSEIETQLATAQQSMITAQEKIGIAQGSVNRAAEMKRREIVSMQIVDDRNTAVLTHTSERNKAEAQAIALTSRLGSLKDRYATALKALESQLAIVENDLRTVNATHDSTAQELANVESLVHADGLRASKVTAQEMQVARHQLAALQAERSRVVSVTQVRAPFSGQVVYRHTTPGFAKDNSPVLALSPGSGFTATVRVAADEVPEIVQAGPVRFELENGILSRFFTGVFRRATPATDDGDFVIAEFDAELPVEAVTRLAASGETVQVQLEWAPNILNDRVFRGSAAVATLGLLGFAMAEANRLIRRRPGRSEAAGADAGIVGGESSAEFRHPETWIRMNEPRLRAQVADFHLKLCNGELRPESLSTLHKALDVFGQDAIRVVQSEIPLDEKVQEAAETWIRRHGDHGLARIIAHLEPRYGAVAA
jgi:multidrug resistance efflux pump